jgi:CheY-like chemotaxis protein
MSRTLLFIEDDEDDVYVIENTLERVGISESVHFVQNGKMAVEYLRTCSTSGLSGQNLLPSLIFLDLNMPVMNGLEFLQWRHQEPEIQMIPVIVLTSSDSHQDMLDAYRLGANAYVVKPVAAAELSALLKAVQAFWLTHNRYIH